MTQHASLSPERWAAFDLDQQILMIGNEMNRATRLIRLDNRSGLLLAYERILRLVDLTVEVQSGYGLRRELLRWRDLIAEMYIGPAPDADQHATAFRCLLQLTPEASRQIPFVLGARPAPPPANSGR
ncbi:MAG TPA: hypothetical protein VOA87_08830 [Thermoanaerobaculia bacterium]|nr:hypothetical protein [Thermoanaerobaculia bacterium]